MDKPYLEPLGGNDFKISYPDEYGRANALMRKVSAGEVSHEEAIEKLTYALKKCPYHFGVANLLGEVYSAADMFEEACNTRFLAAQRFMELMPDDENEEVSLDWEQPDNQPVICLLRGSGIDHFLAGDYEMAAGLLETVLELDGEDHLGVSGTLAFCYIALGEEELFDLTMEDISDKEPDRIILLMWSSLMFRKSIPPELLEEFRTKHKALYDEFIADEHPVTREYLTDVESARPSPEVRARLLWLRTEHLWNEFPEFLISLQRV